MIPMYRTSAEMVKSLVTYIDKPHMVQLYVRERFGGDCPDLRTIRLAREAWLRKAGKHLQRTNAWDKMSRDGKNGCTGAGEQRENEEMMRRGSDLLRIAICEKHPRIMRALEARGNTVVRP